MLIANKKLLNLATTLNLKGQYTPSLLNLLVCTRISLLPRENTSLVMNTNVLRGQVSFFTNIFQACGYVTRNMGRRRQKCSTSSNQSELLKMSSLNIRPVFIIINNSVLMLMYVLMSDSLLESVEVTEI